MYSNEVRKSVTSGAQLAALTSQELESKLGIRNLMHRKKVCLALLARQQGTEDPAGLLDHQVQIVAFHSSPAHAVGVHNCTIFLCSLDVRNI